MQRSQILWIVLMMSIVGQPAAAATIEKSGTFGGLTIRYKVVLPQGYDPSRAYPTVLAFPWGSQDMRMVDMKLEGNWRAEAERRGYVVISPAAPAAGLFFDEGARVFPAFLDQILRDYKVQGGKLHVAGASNGGLSAFSLASHYPTYFISVTGYPGFLPEATPAAIDALKPLCVYMYVGELDAGWLTTSEQQAAQFRSRGLRVRASVEKNQGHAIRTLDGAGAGRFFDNFEEATRGCR